MQVTQPRTTAWRAVAGFGAVSLAADMVYEAGRSLYGPLLGTLGASALAVGVITGVGEAMALVLRVVFGPLADRTRAYWPITIVGYALTAVCVPLLAVTPSLGAAGLAVAATLILAERAGKAIRSPAKSALLAEVAREVGRGRGFGVHKALDQIGAFSGPILVAAIIAVTASMQPALAWLAVPGAVAMGVLFWLRRRVPAPSGSGEPPRSWLADSVGAGLGSRFFLFAASAGLTTAGLVSFGIIGFHLSDDRVLPLAAIPLAYAVGQAAAALIALATGFAYDRVGARVLYALPLLVTAVPVLAFSNLAGVALAGIACWGAATGLQDSTVKALVADLVPTGRRATAYGVFAGIQGATAVAGGALAGWLYQTSLPTLVVVVAITQIAAAALLALTLRRR